MSFGEVGSSLALINVVLSLERQCTDFLDLTLFSLSRPIGLVSRNSAGGVDGRMAAAVALTELAKSFKAFREDVNMRVGEGDFDRSDALLLCICSFSGDHDRDRRADGWQAVLCSGFSGS